MKAYREENIQKGYQIAAKIIQQLGNDYLPIFELLHEELKRSSTKERLIRLAHRIKSTS